MTGLEKSSPSSGVKLFFLVILGVMCCGLLMAGTEYRYIIAGSVAHTNQYSTTETTLTLKYGPDFSKFTSTYGVATRTTEIIEKITNNYRKFDYSVAYKYSPMQPEPENISEWFNNYGKQSQEAKFPFPGGERIFNETCSYWLDTVEQWKTKAHSNKYLKRFYAHQLRSGTGDRLAGALTALNHAIKEGEVVDLAWPKFSLIFQPSSVVENNPPLINILDKPRLLRRKSCKLKSYFECGDETHKADNCPIYNRACIPTETCMAMREKYGTNLNMAHVLGCQMRIMFQPAQTMLDHPVTLFIDNKTVTGTIKELMTYIKHKYETVSVHIRVGDKFMKYSTSDALSRHSQERREMYWKRISTKCVTTVDTYVSNISSGKPVKWIVASDDMSIREYYKTTFPDKVISLESNPIHVDSIFQRNTNGQNKGEDMLNLFAEWFLLGSGDHMVTNAPHNFGVSAFSRSAWIYQLKSEYYEIKSASCLKKKYSYMGAFKEIPLACRNANGTTPDSKPRFPWM